MVTIGVDLAAQPGRTAVCCICWDGDSARVSHLDQGVTDEDLHALWRCERVSKIAIDAPFGWPVDFVRATYAWASLGDWPFGEGDREISRLRLRTTDLWVKQEAGITPLSVSAEKIGRVAMRAAKLLTEAEATHTGEFRVDRSGGGRFVEVYPAAALKIWGSPHHKGYKTAKPEAREKRCKILCHLANRVPGLAITAEQKSEFLTSHDKLDAFVAALVARTAAICCCEPIPTEASELARKEGWIALPRACSLARLTVGVPCSAPPRPDLTELIENSPSDTGRP